MYKPVEQNPPGMLDQGSQVEDNCCYNATCWIFQITTWATLIISIIVAIKGSAGVFASFGISYLVYIILEFCSPTSKYLCNKTSDQGIYQKMGAHFQTPPVITFHCECYHYETRIHYRTNSDGKRESYTTTERVTTYRESYNLPYYSERDVSGLFYLNCDKAMVEQKFYIKLELVEEINFADAISVYDYEESKAAFWRRNRFRDVHFDFRESRTIPGMKHHNLVKLTTEEPCMVNYFWFFLGTVFMFAEFLRMYIDSCCVYQKFKVRKLVSTRYDLNQPVYQVFVPQMNLITQQFEYGQEYYNYVNPSYDLQLPTQEELEAAKKYQDRVPDYQVSSGGGEIQQGVIMDNPGYSSYNPNEAPAEFAAVSGNVALAQDQIVANGGPPPNYNQPGFQFNIAPQEQVPPPTAQNPGYSPNQPGYVQPGQPGQPGYTQQGYPPEQQGYSSNNNQQGYFPPN